MKTIRFFNEAEPRGCSGPCRQGRSACPTPLACRLPEDGHGFWRDGAWAVGLVTFMALVAAFMPPSH